MKKIPQGRQADLLAFCALHHFHQKRKYTNDPYINHCRAVADMADGLCKFGYEVGLCHDLLEDTDCSVDELENALLRFGYGIDTIIIVRCVIELTDVYTHEAFPQLNRTKRKSLEAERLHKISYEAQTVKYCDLINNTESIVEHDKGFAKKYLAEKKTILKGMNTGNPQTYKKCCNVLRNALRKLKKESV